MGRDFFCRDGEAVLGQNLSIDVVLEAVASREWGLLRSHLIGH